MASVPKSGDAGLLLAGAAVAYTYVGYPLLIHVAAEQRRKQPRSSRPTGDVPSITVVIPALDEDSIIAAKVANTATLRYPKNVEIIVVADGSRDDTAAVAEASGARVLFSPERKGKSAAVTRGVAAASGDIVVLTDANCSLADDSLVQAARDFADPAVGIVGGKKLVVGDGTHGAGESLYWRLESRLKAAESEFGAASGAPGEFIAIRRSVFRPIPGHVINDDFWLTCDVLRRGMKVTFAAEAVATERVSEAMSGEYERRTRIAAGTWQVVLTHLQLAHPSHGARAWIFTSHRVMRNVIVPVLLPCLWIGSLAQARRSRLAAVLAVGQTLFYGSAAAGVAVDHAVFSAPTQFALTNLATLRGALRLLGGRQSVAWRRVERGPTIMEDELA